MITYNKMLKDIRKTASSAGLTFKRGNGTINGVATYRFVCRESGRTVLENTTLFTAFHNTMSGYIASYDKVTSSFRGAL